MSQLPEPYQQFRQDHPDVYKAYENILGKLSLSLDHWISKHAS